MHLRKKKEKKEVETKNSKYEKKRKKIQNKSNETVKKNTEKREVNHVGRFKTGENWWNVAETHAWNLSKIVSLGRLTRSTQ